MMKRFFLISIFILTIGVVSAFSQNTRTNKPVKPPEPIYQSSKKKKRGLFKKKKGESQIEAYQKRLKTVRKEKDKRERLSSKKRYNDPRYMGHRRPPKKRPPGKKKFCKVCGIKH